MLKSSESFINRSHLGRPSFLSGAAAGRGKPVAVLMLTSLIDAFSILVVYLLMFFSNTGEMSYVSSEIELPKAAAIERLDRHFIIQIKKSGYFAEERRIESGRLTAFLLGLKRDLAKRGGGEESFSETLTIQADKNIPYDRLSPVIQAAGQTGFSDIKFAVLGE